MSDEDLYFYLNMLKIGKNKKNNIKKNEVNKKIRLKKKRDNASLEHKK